MKSRLGKMDCDDDMDEDDSPVKIGKGHRGMMKTDFIKKSGKKFGVYSESGKLLGSHPDKASAKKQLAAIEINKHK
jgi:hypothetical protein